MPDLRWPKITGLSGIACDPSLSENHGLYEVSRVCKEKREKKYIHPKQLDNFENLQLLGLAGRTQGCVLFCPQEFQAGWRLAISCSLVFTTQGVDGSEPNVIIFSKKNNKKKTNQQQTETPTDNLNLSQVCYDGNKVCLPGGTCSFPPKHQEGQADK